MALRPRLTSLTNGLIKWHKTRNAFLSRSSLLITHCIFYMRP
jgi:hypothetical protein